MQKINNSIPYSSIYAVSYYISSSQENEIDSTVEIENKDLYHGDFPAEGGIYDARMGTTDKSWRCSTCGLMKPYCPGHFGHINLRYPIKNPMFRDYILKFLKVICFRCGRLIITKDIKGPRSRRLMEYARIQSPARCPWADCGELHPKIIQDKVDPTVFYAEYTGAEGRTEVRELFNHMIYEVLSKITSDTVETLGWLERSHPKNLILDTIRIVPNTARPYIKRQTNSKINSSDDITSLTKLLMENNLKLQSTMPSLEVVKQIRTNYNLLDMLYFNMVKGSANGEITLNGHAGSGKTFKSLAQRLNKKEGRIRRNLLGKRTRYMMRSVLTCDPSLEVDQVGVPLSIATSMQIPEVVRPYNKERLQIYFNNKHDIYPGCTHVWKANKGERYIVDKVASLEYGDIIYRDLIDGDIIAINRQPSLLFGSIVGMRCVIMEVGESLRINESACAPLNADFDGDAVNGIVCLNIQARNELALLSELEQIFISRQKHTPYFGCFQDSLIGSAQLTRSHIKMNKWHAMMLFSNIILKNNLDISFSKQTYTGRDLYGRFLPKINYPKRGAQIYNPDYAGMIPYDPNDIFVEVNRGELVSGILDKKSIGQGKPGTLFHIINNDYGSRRALDTLHNAHQIIMKFLLTTSFTIGIKDIILPDHAVAAIQEKTKLIIQEANEVTERAHRRELISPIGTPLEMFYETEIMSKLTIGDDFIEHIYNNIDTQEGLLWCVLTGSKGDQRNAMAIYAAIGQMMIGSKRQSKNFGYGRTSPYFLRSDRSPRANGFIDNSYREGVAPDIYAFMAAESRFNEIMKALSTSVAGAQGRICTRNIESIMVGNLYNSVKKDSIIQFLYADTGIDPKKVDSVKFLTALISDKELEEKFKSHPKDFHKIYQNKNLEIQLKEEFECIKNDRELFREVAFRLHNGNIGKNGLINNERFMPINPYRIIEDVLYTYKEEVSQDSSKFNPIQAILDVKKLCNSLAYCYFNETYEKNNNTIPEYIDKALTLNRILIRSYLCTANLRKKGVTNKLLNIIIEKIKTTYKKALIPYGLAVGVISAQCISEPQTQYVIDSKLRSGGAGGTKTSVIDRIKEIFGGKTTEEMKNVSMLIMLKREISSNKARVQEVANNLEMMNFDRFVDNTKIFFEKYGQPVHPEFVHEGKWINSFAKSYNSDPPSNLSKWCIRFEINKEELIISGMKFLTLVVKLQSKHSNIHFVYTAESASQIVVRAYIPNDQIKQNPEQSAINVADKILNTIIRGLKGIIYTEVVEVPVSVLQDDGSITNVKEWAIETNGSNLEEVLEHPSVDKYRTQTDSIDEVCNMFGIEAARLKIINEAQKTMSTSDAATEHMMIIADEMCSSGVITSIQKTGLQSRDAGNVALQLAFQAPIQVIEKAAVNGIVDKVQGISSHFIYGQIPSVGTTYNDVIINEKWVEEWHKNVKKSI